MTPDFFKDLEPAHQETPQTPDFFSQIEPQSSEVPDFYAATPMQQSVQSSSQNMQSSVQQPATSSGAPPLYPEEMSYWDRVKDYFSSGALGKAAVMQIQSGGFAGAPAFTKDVAKEVGREVGTVAAVELAFVPIVGAAAASAIAPGILTSLAHLTRAGATGAATATTSSLMHKGELPSKEEILKEGLTWIALDAGLQALFKAGGLSYEFGSAINRLAEKEGVPATTILGRLWDATKGYVKSKFGRTIETPNDIKIEDVKLLVDRTKQAEEKGFKDAIDITDEIEVNPIKEKAVANAKQPKAIESAQEPNRVQPSNAEPTKPAGLTVEPESKIPEEGKPYTFEFVRNTEKSPDLGSRFGQDVEPSGRYMREGKAEHVKDMPKMQTGEVTFEKPLVIEWGEGYGKPGNWKNVLSKRYEGKTGKELSQAIRDEGFDGIITLETDKRGHTYTSEIVDLTSFKPKEKVVLEGGKELPKKRQVPPKQTRPKQPVMGKKQAVARSKIIKVFQKAFNDPIRIGKFKQRALGIHKLWPKVTRLLKANDVETAAHEIGHNLHTTLYGGDAADPQIQAHNINQALRPYLDELKPLAHYEPWGMEGFAEFTRLFVTNPDVAKELAPKFYQKFENDLRADYPEMLNALLEARDYYDSYLQGTPQSRIRAQTSYASDKGKLENILDSLKEFFDLDSLNTKFIDDVYPAKRLVAEAFGIPINEVENLKDPLNLYRSLRLLKGGVGKGDVYILHETFDPITLDKINGSLKDIIDQLPDENSYKEFNDYLIARRVIEKSGQGIETGIHIGDAIYVEDALRPIYGDLAKELDKYNDSLLKYALKSGLISKQQYNLIKDNNLMYVPFQRVMEKETKGMSSGSGKLQATNPFKQMTGSARDLIAPLESIIKNTYSIIMNSEKNLVGQVLAKLAANKKNIGSYVEKLPTPIKLKGKIEGTQVSKELAKRFEQEGLFDLIEYDEDGNVHLRPDIADSVPEVFLKFGAGKYPPGENIITVYDKGKPLYYEVSPEIFEMWQKGISPYISNILVKILSIPARTLRAGAIVNPKFWEKNIVRDTWESFIFTKYGKSTKDPVGLFLDTVYSPLAMLSVAAKRSNLYVEWLKSGGGMSTMQGMDRQSVVKKLDQIQKGVRPHQIMKMMRMMGEITEEANRLAEFGRALEINGKTRLGREIAAFAARDLSIDYAKMGLLTKALNQIIPFWNANVQGTNKFWRMMASVKDRPKAISRMVAFIVIPALILAWINKDDKNIKEFYDEERDFNFIIPTGGGEYKKIPVPFAPGVFANGLTTRMFDYFMTKDPEAFEGFMGSVISAISPNFIPTIQLPGMETAANKNFFTGAPIIPRDKQDLISKYQYKNNTSQTARLLGRAMTYMLGEDTRSKWASPAVIDHFINSWTGGLGRLLINISDASLEAAGLVDKIPGPSQTITERFGLDAFSTRFPRANTRSIEKFYNNYFDAMSREKSLKYAQKMDLDSDKEIEKGYERIEKIYDVDSLKSAYKAIQSCQREINNIWHDPEINADLKRQMIDDLYIQMIDFSRAANEDIKKYRLAQPDS